MLRPHGQRLGQFFGPGFDRLFGPRVDQIEGGAGKYRAREPDRFNGLGPVVAAPEKAERPVVKRLDPDRQAVDSGGPEIPEAPGLNGGRICFQATASISAALVAGAIRDGVPPPKKMLTIFLSGN
jgi:hypothetical protein